VKSSFRRCIPPSTFDCLNHVYGIWSHLHKSFLSVCVSVCLSRLLLLGNGSVNTYQQQRRIVGFSFCAVRVATKENGRLVRLRTRFCDCNEDLKYLPKPSNTKIIQRLQSKVLRTITSTPWYVSNYTLRNDLQIPVITEEIKRYSTLYYNRLIGLENSYVTEVRNPLNVRRRLKRQWPSDLKDQREEEE
jgi:hypothetical protein